MRCDCKLESVFGRQFIDGATLSHPPVQPRTEARRAKFGSNASVTVLEHATVKQQVFCSSTKLTAEGTCNVQP